MEILERQQSKIEEGISRLHDRLEKEEFEVNKGDSQLSEFDLNDTRAISRIYDLLKEYRQWDLGPNRMTKKLVKIKCWIDYPDRVAAENNWEGREMPELVICGGAFTVLEVYTLPMQYVTRESLYNPSLGEYQDSYLIHRDAIGKEIPSWNDVAYNTFLPLTDEYGVCLTLRGPHRWLRDYITNTWNWEFIQCDI